MNPDEQFIMVVLDHGSNLSKDNAPQNKGGGTWSSRKLNIGPFILLDMQRDPKNIPKATVFSPGPTRPSSVTISTNQQTISNVSFDIEIAINGDGDLDDEGEGWEAHARINEGCLDPVGEIVSVSGDKSLQLTNIALASGAIKKTDRHFNKFPGLWT